jgi:uncharacterized membrane protein
MSEEWKYSRTAQAVINDYLDRLKERLAGFPSADRNDLMREIEGHIDESFSGESGGDEIERLLRVLRRLGELTEVVSERMAPALIELGKKKGLPFYVMSGVLIGLFGLPLGLGAVGILVGVLASILGLLVAYFATAFSLLATGLTGLALSIVHLSDPGIIERINEALGGDIFHLTIAGSPLSLYLSPRAEALVTYLFCASLTALGIFMIWGGRYFLRGIRYLFRMSWKKIEETIRRQRRAHAAGQSSWIASVCR